MLACLPSASRRHKRVGWCQGLELCPINRNLWIISLVPILTPTLFVIRTDRAGGFIIIWLHRTTCPVQAHHRLDLQRHSNPGLRAGYHQSITHEDQALDPAISAEARCPASSGAKDIGDLSRKQLMDAYLHQVRPAPSA